MQNAEASYLLSVLLFSFSCVFSFLLLLLLASSLLWLCFTSLVSFSFSCFYVVSWAKIDINMLGLVLIYCGLVWHMTNLFTNSLIALFLSSSVYHTPLFFSPGVHSFLSLFPCFCFVVVLLLLLPPKNFDCCDLLTEMRIKFFSRKKVSSPPFIYFGYHHQSFPRIVSFLLLFCRTLVSLSKGILFHAKYLSIRLHACTHTPTPLF